MPCLSSCEEFYRRNKRLKNKIKVVEDTKEFLSSRELDKAFVTRFATITQGAGLVPNQSYTLT